MGGGNREFGKKVGTGSHIRTVGEDLWHVLLVEDNRFVTKSINANTIVIMLPQ